MDALSHNSYTIETLSQSPEPCPLDSKITVSVAILKWLLWAVYFSWRFATLCKFHCSDYRAQYLAWLSFLVEVLALLPSFLSQLDHSLYLIYGNRNWRRQKLCLIGNVAPVVNVFITSCGESIDLVLDTVAAAASQEYPCDRYRVFILDDVSSSSLKRAVSIFKTELAKKRAALPEIIYLARTKVPGKLTYFKAGNLHFGITESRSLGLESEFIAALDVDAIAKRDWLRRSVPHLVLDPKLALVNTAQASYNLAHNDLFDHGSTASGWPDLIRDNLGTGTCYGSGYIMRRSALDSICGWPKVAVGEDIFCGYLLAGHGWKIACCMECLQSDLAPCSMESLIKQRMRWMDGDLNLVRYFNFFLPGMDPCPNRTLPQRLSAIINSIRLFRAITDTLFPIVMALCFLALAQHMSHVTSISLTDRTALQLAYLASITAHKLDSVLMHGGLSGLTNSELWISPFKAMRVLRFCLGDTLFSFTPTGTVISGVNERSDRRRLPLYNRLMTQPSKISALFTIIVTVPLVIFLMDNGNRNHRAVYSTGVFVWLLECMFKMSAPFRYMMWPPSIPERRQLLQRDEYGIHRPGKRQPTSSRNFLEIPWLDVMQLILVLYLDWYLQP